MSNRPRLFTREEATEMTRNGHWIKGISKNASCWMRWNGTGLFEEWEPTHRIRALIDDFYLVSAYTGPPLAIEPPPICETYQTIAGIEIRPSGDGVYLCVAKEVEK